MKRRTAHGEPETRLGQIAAACFAAVAVAIAGFGGLYALWTTRSWPSDLPGLFDYASATFGDGVLLPLGVGILVGITRSPRLLAAPNELRWAIGVGFAGLAVGVLLQLAWLTDADPIENWTLPAAGRFNYAGVYHAVFLIGMSGVVAALTTVVARRLICTRKADPERVALLARSPWNGILLGVAVAMAGLIAIDTTPAGDTQAALATWTVLAAAGAMGLLVLGIALRGALLAAASQLALGLTAAIGVCALAAYGLPGDIWLTTACIATGVLGGLAVSGPLEERRPSAPLNAVASALIILGGISIALEHARIDGHVALVAAIVGAAWGTGAGRVGGGSWAGAGWLFAGLFYAMGVLALTGWLQQGEATNAEARLAAGGAEFALDLLVLSVLYRFRALSKAEEEARNRDDPLTQPRGLGAHIWIQVLGVGVPGVLALLVLLVTAGPLTGIDDLAGGAPESFGGGVRALTIAVLLVASGAAAARILGQRPERPRLHREIRLPLLAAILVGLACVVWGVGGIRGLGSELHHPAVAAFFALSIAALTTEDLVNSSVRLQLAKPGRGGIAISILAGGASGAAMFWLLTTGLWDGDQPASTASSILATITVLVGSAMIASLAGTAIAMSLPGPYLTAEPPALNMVLGQTLYAVLGLFFIVAPVFIVGRIADVGLTNSGLVAASSAGMMPALLTGLLIVLDNNRQHATAESKTEGKPRNIEQYDLSAEEEPFAEERERTALLRAHMYWQNAMAWSVLSVAGLWSLWELL